MKVGQQWQIDEKKFFRCFKVSACSNRKTTTIERTQVIFKIWERHDYKTKNLFLLHWIVAYKKIL